MYTATRKAIIILKKVYILTAHAHAFLAGTFSRDLDKMIYLQNRRYLQLNDELRSDRVNFPDKEEEHRMAPKIKDYYEMKTVHVAFESVSSK